MRVDFVGVWVHAPMPASWTFLAFFMSWAAVFASGAFLGLRKGVQARRRLRAQRFCFFGFLPRLLLFAAFPCLSHAAVVPFLRLPLVILQRFSLFSCSRHCFSADTSFASDIASQTPSLLLVSLLSLTPSSSPLSLFAFRHFWGMLLNYGVEIRS